MSFDLLRRGWERLLICFVFSDPASLDFFWREVWLFCSYSASCFSLYTMNILPIDQQPKWQFITTYKDGPNFSVTALAHTCIIWANSILYKSTRIWLYNRPVCLRQDLIHLQITKQRLYHWANLPVTWKIYIQIQFFGRQFIFK